MDDTTYDEDEMLMDNDGDDDVSYVPLGGKGKKREREREDRRWEEGGGEQPVPYYRMVLHIVWYDIIFVCVVFTTYIYYVPR